MDHFHLNKLREADIDRVVIASGGRRVESDCTGDEAPNADYILGDAVMELKLFDEEGLEKRTRQEKLAKLFTRNQPGRPVIVLDPDILSDTDRRNYYNALEGPIKTQVKKASKQLDATLHLQTEARSRVLLAINNGYTALSHKEFLERVVKCARNDTSRIDVVVVAGCYYYSDKFDYYLLAPIDMVPLNRGRGFGLFDRFRQEWNTSISEKLMATIRGDEAIENLKNPVLDLVYEVDGVKFVKPSPSIGGDTSFFPDGRPRENSTGLVRCPSVALTFPRLTLEEWQHFKQEMPNERHLGKTHTAYADFARKEENKTYDPKQPFVPVAITFEGFRQWQSSSEARPDFYGLCEYACTIFETELRYMMDSAKPASDDGILYPHYILLKTEEIGQDTALDLCSIYNRSAFPGLERDDVIVKDLNIFFEHGKALAAAYALKYGVSAIQYEIDKTYCWF